MTTAGVLDETPITIYGGLCHDCGAEFGPAHRRDGPEYRELWEQIEREWKGDALWAPWLQTQWPRRYPAWLVREGFQCPFCNAASILLDLGGVA